MTVIRGKAGRPAQHGETSAVSFIALPESAAAEERGRGAHGRQTLQFDQGRRGGNSP